MKIKNRGISLIVLIITIIILTILAGVVILNVTSENGLIPSVKQATEQAEISNELDIIKLAINDIMVENLTSIISASDLKEKLENEGLKVADIEGTNPLMVTMEDTNRLYEISIQDSKYAGIAKNKWELSEDGVTLIQPANGPKEEDKSIQIGEVVDYNCASVSNGAPLSYVSKYSNTGWAADQIFTLANYMGKWTVLGQENGRIMLISDIIYPDGEDAYVIAGKIGYVNGPSELKRVATIYGNGKGAVGARVIQNVDVDNITGYDKTTYKAGQNVLYVYGNEVTYEKTATGLKYYGTLNSVSGTSGSKCIYYDGTGWKTLTDVGEKFTCTSNYYTYVATEASSSFTSADPRYKILFGENNELDYWLADSWIRPLDGYVNMGIKIVQGSCSDGPSVERNYMFMSEGTEIKGDKTDSMYERVGMRVLVYLSHNANLVKNKVTGILEIK